MGTNYYINGQHIGKRSAAGLYCWDCKTTLCKDGEEGVHTGKSEWHDACPVCGAIAKEEKLDESTAGRELGFNKTKSQKKTGVASCSSFSWAMSEVDFYVVAANRTIVNSICGKGLDKSIRDEYGDSFSLKEFRQVLEECPIQYFDSIGVCFC